MSTNVTAVILAAGKGTRMKSSRAKVLHEVFCKPMLHHVLDAVNGASIEHCAVIVGHQRDTVLASLLDYLFTPIIQEEQLGTGHAVLCAEAACQGSEMVMILCGDTPLIRPETLQAMITAHQRTAATLTLMTTELDTPFGYGRILSDDRNNVLEIVEEKDATPQQQAIRSINAGIYCVERDFLFSALKQVGTDNSQGEVYLTDIVAIANRQGKKVHTFSHAHAMDVLGVNSRVELAQAHRELQMRYNQKLMLAGVTMYTPETILVAPTCSVGLDTILSAGIEITGRSGIGKDCRIGTGAILHNCQIGDGAVIGSHAVLHTCRIEPAEHIPPLTHRVG